MNIETAIALAALAVVLVAYVISAVKSRQSVARAKSERNEIYRSCFLRGLAGILARMAKADGTVSLEEEGVASKLFNDMGLDAGDRDLCLEAFKVAKDSNLPMSYYASLFAPYSTKDSRALVYEILWDITAADGRLDPAESKSLKEMVNWLSLDPAEYARNEKRCASRLTGLSDAARKAGEKIDRVLRG